MQNTPSPSRIVLMASGAVLFIFSFLAFVKGEEYDMNTGDVVDKSFNAWSGDAGTLFLATWPALFGLLIAGLVAAITFGNVSLPDRVLTFTWPQLYTLLSFTGFVIMLGYLLGGGFPDVGGGPDKGIGFWLMLLGSVGLLAGSVMELLDDGRGGSPRPGQAPPTSF